MAWSVTGPEDEGGIAWPGGSGGARGAPVLPAPLPGLWGCPGECGCWAGPGAGPAGEGRTPRFPAPPASGTRRGHSPPASESPLHRGVIYGQRNTRPEWPAGEVAAATAPGGVSGDHLGHRDGRRGHPWPRVCSGVFPALVTGAFGVSLLSVNNSVCALRTAPFPAAQSRFPACGWRAPSLGQRLPRRMFKSLRRGHFTAFSFNAGSALGVTAQTRLPNPRPERFFSCFVLWGAELCGFRAARDSWGAGLGPGGASAPSSTTGR